MLKQWRTERGLSLRQVAVTARLSASTIGRWEREECLPRLPEMEAILQAFQASATQRKRAMALMDAPRAQVYLRNSLTQEQPELVSLLGLPPGRGDLLRAMRLRRGKTLEEAAQAAGISAGTLSRWERQEVWPTAEELHALCWALGAHVAELEALACERTFSLPSVNSSDADTLRRLIRAVWLGNMPDGEALRDLYCVSLHAQLWKLASRHSWALTCLGELFAFQARALLERQRGTEARVYVEHASELYRRPEASASTRSNLALIAASLAVEGSPRPDRRLAVRILKQGVQHAEIPAYRAWMLSEMAQHLAQEGQAESAMALSQRARQVVLEGRNVGADELAFRGYDHARTLLLAGKAGDALDALLPLSSLPQSSSYLAARCRLLEAEALASLGKRAEAHTILTGALSAIERHNFYYLRPQADTLTALF